MYVNSKGKAGARETRVRAENTAWEMKAHAEFESLEQHLGELQE